MSHNDNKIIVEREEYLSLYDELSPKVYRIALLYLQDSEYAKDILQDVFTMLWNHREYLKEDIQTIESYLFQCTRNKAIDMLRKQKNQQTYIGYLGNNDSFSNDTEKMVSFRFLQQEVKGVVDRLPEKCRAVYKLSKEENLDNKTIAYRLNISEKTVKNHLTKALAFLRTHLKYKI